MTLNDSIKITKLLLAQISQCTALTVGNEVHSQQDYERALMVVLEAAKAHQNDNWGH